MLGIGAIKPLIVSSINGQTISSSFPLLSFEALSALKDNEDAISA